MRIALDDIAHVVHIWAMLAAWMEKEGLNDAQVSVRLGRVISRSQVSRIRRGISVSTPKVAQLLEGLTGIPAWEFVRPETDRSGRAA